VALALNERFLTGRGVGALGTYASPLPIQYDLTKSEGCQLTYQLRVGYEAIPSTRVMGFWIPNPAQLKVKLVSDDPYIHHVACALAGPDDIRGPGRRQLISTFDLDGDWVDLSRGQWWVTFSTIMPVDVTFHAIVHLKPLPKPLHAWTHGLRIPSKLLSTPKALFSSINSPAQSMLLHSPIAAIGVIPAPAPAAAIARRLRRPVFKSLRKRGKHPI
jgi:hypothetical protein